VTDSSSIRLHRLGPNKVPVYYEGGDGIDRFRHEHGTDGPEDWVGSVTAFPKLLLPAGADPKTGISRLSDGTRLDVYVAANPEGWLGPELHRSFGSEPGLLVKLLDAGERLPVHWHPDRDFANDHLASRFGKNEGWIVLAARADARIWLGFTRDVDAGELRSWVDDQDAEAMLAAMNVFTPKPGEVYYIPAGVPHAIGGGITIVELQEPTSFSILAEYRSFGVDDAAASLGLEWELALSCVDARAYAGEFRDVLRPLQLVASREGGTLGRLYSNETEPYFQAYRALATGGALALGGPEFRIVVVESGKGALTTSADKEAVREGETWLVPYGAGELTLEGLVEAIVCCPPKVTG
jgi:mannose-6-phosphate isomerase